jgi:hypothetical protein
MDLSDLAILKEETRQKIAFNSVLAAGSNLD